MSISIKIQGTEPYIDDLELYLLDSRVLFHEKYKRKFRNRGNATLEDFERRRILGRGSFGTVVAVTSKTTHRSYAMKILEKKTVVDQRQVEHTFAEKRVLQAVSFPFVVNLKFFFLDQCYLYLLMPLALCGEMYDNLRQSKNFSEDLSRFYAAQVVLAFEYLHFLDLIYRDLKPENIVIFDNGYLKLADFGFCKVVIGRTYTFCGTPEYMAPEILQNRGYGKSVDWWSLGILIYEMMVGFSPFQAGNVKQTYERIIVAKIRYPKGMAQAVKHIIRHLVEPDLTRRYGNLRSGVKDVKQHPWFQELDWTALLNQSVPAPFVPPIRSLEEDGVGEPYNPKRFAIKSQQGRYTNLFKDF